MSETERKLVDLVEKVEELHEKVGKNLLPHETL